MAPSSYLIRDSEREIPPTTNANPSPLSVTFCRTIESSNHYKEPAYYYMCKCSARSRRLRYSPRHVVSSQLHMSDKVSGVRVGGGGETERAASYFRVCCKLRHGPPPSIDLSLLNSSQIDDKADFQTSHLFSVLSFLFTPTPKSRSLKTLRIEYPRMGLCLLSWTKIGGNRNFVMRYDALSGHRLLLETPRETMDTSTFFRVNLCSTPSLISLGPLTRTDDFTSMC